MKRFFKETQIARATVTKQTETEKYEDFKLKFEKVSEKVYPQVNKRTKKTPHPN